MAEQEYTGTADGVAIAEDAGHIVPLIYDDVPPLPGGPTS